MSATNATRIFGIRVGVDPKILIGGLVVIAGLLFWYNSSSDDSVASPAATPTATAIANNPSYIAPVRPAPARRRGTALASDRSALRIPVVDPTRGDIDPTLRLDLLQRLRTLQPSPATRSLFEIGTLASAATAAPPKIKAPIITPGPQTPIGNAGGPSTTFSTALNIPLKYYGYAKPSSPQAINQGLFLFDDNVLVASEGQVVNGKYLVVELTPSSARLEDTNLKQGQTLPVVPVAQP